MSHPIVEAIRNHRIVPAGARWQQRAREQFEFLRHGEAPPGPTLGDLSRQLLGGRSSTTLDFLESIKVHGDMACIQVPGEPIYVMRTPELLEQVLLRQHKKFIKSRMTRDLAQLVGRGLLTNEGESWKQQRKLMSPPLQRKHIASYAQAMVAATERWSEGWKPGETRDLHKEMMGLTLEITVKTLFDTEMSGQSERVAELLEEAMDTMQVLQQTWRRFLPRRLPTRRHRAMRRIAAEIHDILQGFIEARQKAFHEDEHAAEEAKDLLSLLVRARDEEGRGMSAQQLRDEVITIFIAGHETTALALTYTFHLLSQHPEVSERVRRELSDVLDGRSATASDVSALTYTNAVVKESLRLYPPAWAMGREAAESVEVGGYVIPTGAQVLLSTWLVHRDARYYDNPTTFDPERWLDGRTDDLPRMAWVPFGDGPRVCIGNHFALMEVVLVVATALQRLDVAPTTNKLEVDPSITLRPSSPVPMRFSPR